MDAGHGGKSGRFRRYKEVALEYAFLLNAPLGKKITPYKRWEFFDIKIISRNELFNTPAAGIAREHSYWAN